MAESINKSLFSVRNCSYISNIMISTVQDQMKNYQSSEYGRGWGWVE